MARKKTTKRTPRAGSRRLVTMALEHGATAAQVVDAAAVETAGWVRWKCRFGCSGYGGSLVCPPHTPTPEETQALLDGFARAVLFCRTGILTPNELAPHFRQALSHHQPAAEDFAPGLRRAGQETTFAERLASSEREILEQALREHGNNRTATAKALGLSRVGLYKKMKKYGMITPRGSRDPSNN